MSGPVVTCPLCASPVTYIGLNNLECSGPTTCPNVSKETVLDRVKRELEDMHTEWMGWPGPYFGP